MGSALLEVIEREEIPVEFLERLPLGLGTLSHSAPAPSSLPHH